MGSKTQQTSIRRANKTKKLGEKRKKADRNKGTTPKFAIHPDKK